MCLYLMNYIEDNKIESNFFTVADRRNFLNKIVWVILYMHDIMMKKTENFPISQFN